MVKYITLLLLITSPVFLKAQPPMWGNDSASQKIIEHDCDSKIFTRVEQLPSLKLSLSKFEDTLTSLLKSKNAFYKTDRLVFKFIVTTQSQIFDLTREKGEAKKESIVKESLQSLSNLWLPAIQNGRAVCAYVRLEMIIEENKLNIKIVQ